VIDPTIIYEDGDVLVINKPAGVSVHKDGMREEETIADWFVRKYPEAGGVGEPLTLTNGTVVDRPGIVHRLDKETSGVMVLAKNQRAYEFLKKQFQERETAKIYRTFVWGEMKNDSGTINLPIGRSQSDFRRRSAERGAKEPLRDAETHYEVLLRGGGFSEVRVKPKTGRMHQIRVHMKALQHPLVGDMLYAPRREYALGFERLALHAESLTITLPSGTKHTFEAPLPSDIEEAGRTLRQFAETA